MTNGFRSQFIELLRHGTTLAAVLCLFALCHPVEAFAQKKKRAATDEKIYLDHADELQYNQMEMPGVQVVRGRVEFRYQDSRLNCDSAYFNQQQNSFRAFGHVKMRKSGGITITCDRANYYGLSGMVEARQNVVLTQPGRSLHCDSLDYNSNTDYANYFGGKGGTLVDGKNKIVSRRGEYYLSQHEANFFDDVVMTSPQYRITTDNLFYNTQTEEAHVTGPSVIKTNKGEVINTTDGYYYSRTDHMELNGRSTITSEERDIVGDNLRYNNKTGDSEGHGDVKMVDKVNDRVITGDNVFYNEKSRKGHGEGNVVYIDRKNKNSLKAQFVDYTDSAAVATGSPLVKDFSQKDTLYMSSDTIRMKAFNLDTDSVYRKIHCYNNVRMYRRDLQAVCGLMIYNTKDSCMTMYQDPIVWSDERQLFGDSIKAYTNDSTLREAYVMGQAMSIEMARDRENYNQISSRLMHAYFTDGKLRRTDAIGNVLSVFCPEDDKDSTLIGLIYMETDTMRMFVTPTKQLDHIWSSKSEGTMYPMTQIPPGKDRLPGFAWFDYIRPLDPDDLYRRVGKGDNLKLMRQVAIRPPRQRIDGSREEQR